MLKKTQVVMLPTTKEATYICKVTEGTSNFPKDKLVLTYDGHMALCGKAINQQLYFLSDEKIEEGDWYFDMYKNIYQRKGEVGNLCKKIIATTDNSLQVHKEGVNNTDYWVELPEPSPEFIKKYVTKYNKGEQIISVMVEYEKLFTGWNEDQSEKTHDEFIKVNPKDNTITIKPIKDNWTREELDRILNDVMNLGMVLRQNQLAGSVEKSGIEVLNYWKDKNL